MILPIQEIISRSITIGRQVEFKTPEPSQTNEPINNQEVEPTPESSTTPNGPANLGHGAGLGGIMIFLSIALSIVFGRIALVCVFQRVYGRSHGRRENNELSKERRVIVGEDEENPKLIVFEIPQPVAKQKQKQNRLVVYSSANNGILKSYHPSEEHKDMTCALCLDDLSIRKIASFPCKHPLHEDCFKSWIVKSKRLDCPICAQDFSDYVEEDNKE